MRTTLDRTIQSWILFYAYMALCLAGILLCLTGLGQTVLRWWTGTASALTIAAVGWTLVVGLVYFVITTLRLAREYVVRRAGSPLPASK
jgi:hypothetical protein